MEDFLAALGGNILWVMGGGVAVIAIVGSFIRDIFRIRSVERSRREIAAYIAEGSMSAEQGERLMKAHTDADNCGNC
ncbi:MAG: hypothetical protein RIB32_02880 [Phycisphaerales bacterium]